MENVICDCCGYKTKSELKHQIFSDYLQDAGYCPKCLCGQLIKSEAGKK
jgi:hypothetical protein